MKKFIFMLFMVMPLFAQEKLAEPVSNASDSYVIENSSYKLGFAGTYGSPVWEMHLLTPEMLSGTAEANTNWKVDNRIKGYRLTLKDFDSRYEPVQLFPETHAQNNTENKESSYYLSNLVFMSRQLKESIWNKITESFEGIARTHKSAYLYAGPIFDKDSFKIRYILNNKIAFPSHFYRIILYYENGKPQCKCYKIPNRIPTEYERACSLEAFACNLYQLEAETNIDFFDREIDANFRKDKMKFLEGQIQ